MHSAPWYVGMLHIPSRLSASFDIGTPNSLFYVHALIHYMYISGRKFEEPNRKEWLDEQYSKTSTFVYFL